MSSLTNNESPMSSLLQSANFLCPSGKNCTSPCYKCASCGVQNSTEKLCNAVDKNMTQMYNRSSNNSDNNSSNMMCNSSNLGVEVEEIHFVQEVVVGRRKRSLSIDKVKGALFKQPTNWKTNEISMEEINKHNTLEDCWIIAKNKVYNATPFISIHPGGIKSILRRAGGVKDCSIDFDFHSTNGRKVWQKYQIGIVEGTRSSCQIM
jgi:cytochrome b involved in lipid metabolism